MGESLKSTLMMSRADKYLARNYNPLPAVITSALGCWYKDVNGNQILDMLAGYSVANFGHGHPRIVRAIMEQAQKLMVVPRSLYSDKLAEFSEVLADFCGMDKVLPSNGGVEAYETALKISRKWGYENKGIPGGRAEIIVCYGNFHGRTLGAISASDVPEYRSGFEPLLPGFKWIPFGDAYALAKSITRNTAAFFVEPIQGEGGINIPYEGYLRDVVSICRGHNILSVFDEIQTGFGRTGYDLAHQHEERAKPDMLIVGKSLGSGIAVSAVAADNHIMKVMTPGIHGSTYGGNPLACAAAIEAIGILRDEKMSERSATMGAYFLSRLKEIRSPLIKEVRGRGLMIGLELVREAGGARHFCEALLQEGIFCKETHENVIRLTPPLVISRVDIDWVLKRIEKVLEECSN